MFLGTLIITQILVLIFSCWSIYDLNLYSSGELSSLSSEASSIGENLLKEQSEKYLKNMADYSSKRAEGILEEVSNEVDSLCSGIQKIYYSENNFKSDIPLLPELTSEGEREFASLKAYAIDLENSNSDSPLVYNSSEYERAGNLASFSSKDWESMSTEEKEEITKKNTVVSNNIIPANIYREICLLGNSKYIFEPIFKSNQYISSIYFGTQNGIFLKYSAENSSKRYDYRSRNWYKSAIQTNSEGKTSPIWQNTYISKSNGKLCVTCSKAVKNLDGTVLGVCAIDMCLDDITEFIERSKIGDNGYNFIIDNEGGIIMHPLYTSFFENSSLPNNLSIENSGMIKNILENKNEMIETEIGGKAYLASSVSMNTNDWIWVSVAEKSEFMKPISKIQELINKKSDESKTSLNKDFMVVISKFGILFSIVLILSYIVCVKLAKNISRPLITLNKETKNIGKGDFYLNLPVDSKDEVGELAASFNLMAKNLKKYTEDLARTVSEKQKIHSELMIANKIQSSMLPYIFPAFPERKDLDIYAIMDPATEIGGDFYDFFFIDKNKLALVIADVSGKGVSAALFMVIAKILIKNQLQNGYCPSEALKIVNNSLCENNEAGMFVTSFLGVIDIKTGEFTYANAGHNPPMICRHESKECIPITSPHGFVLGGVKNLDYTQDKTYLYPGDIIFLYTDGVTEASNAKGKLFSQKRLEEVLKYCINKNMKIKDMITYIREKIDNFSGPQERSDDITMLAFKNFTIVPYDQKNPNSEI